MRKEDTKDEMKDKKRRYEYNKKTARGEEGGGKDRGGGDGEKRRQGERREGELTSGKKVT